jgi:hypothetical protein
VTYWISHLRVFFHTVRISWLLVEYLLVLCSMVHISCWGNSDLKLCRFRIGLGSGFRAACRLNINFCNKKYWQLIVSWLCFTFQYVVCLMYCSLVDFYHDRALQVVLRALSSVPTDHLWNFLEGRWRFLSLTSTLRQGLKSLTSTFSLAATSLGMWLGLPYISVLHILHWIYTVLIFV